MGGGARSCCTRAGARPVTREPVSSFASPAPPPPPSTDLTAGGTSADDGAADAKTRDAEGGGGGGAGRRRTSPRPHGMASASSWLLRVMAHALDADVAEQWRVLHTATTAGSRDALRAADSRHRGGAVRRAARPRGGAALDARAHLLDAAVPRDALCGEGGVVQPAEGENLEGIGMPMRTSVGVPFCCGGGGVSIFVAYLQRRVEEDGPRLAFLAQLQLLAASLEDLARSTAPPAAASPAPSPAACSARARPPTRRRRRRRRTRRRAAAAAACASGAAS